jgi:uncharacterized protein
MFTQAVSKADYYIDMHGADLIEDLTPFAQFWHTDNPEVDAISSEMAWHHVMPLVLANYGQPVRRGASSGSAYAAASWAGIPSMMAEAGVLGTLGEDAVELHLNGLANVLRFLKVLPGESARAQAKAIRYAALIKAEEQAVFVSHANPGNSVTKGQPLGYYHDLLGKRLAPIVAPEDGIVLWRRSSPPVQQGANVIAIAKFEA